MTDTFKDPLFDTPKINVYNKEMIEKMFTGNLNYETDYQAQNVMDLKKYKDFVQENFPQVLKNLKLTEQYFARLENLFYHLVHSSETPQDQLNKFMLNVDSKINQYFQEFDHCVLNNQPLSYTVLGKQIKKGYEDDNIDDYRISQQLQEDAKKAKKHVETIFNMSEFRQILKEEVIKVSDKLNENFIQKVTPQGYEKKVIKKIEQILRLYSFMRSDTGIICQYTALKYGELLKNLVSGEGSKSLSYSDLLILNLDAIVENTIDAEFERTYPVFMHKKDLTVERLHDILKEREESIPEIIPINIYKNILNRERRKVYRKVYSTIMKYIDAPSKDDRILKNKEYLEQTQINLVKQMNEIKNDFLKLKGEDTYIDIISGRLTERQVKETTLHFNNMEFFIKIEKFIMQSHTLLADIQAALSHMIELKTDEQHYFKETFAKILNDTIMNLYEEERQISKFQSSTTIPQLVKEAFQQLSHMLNEQELQKALEEENQNKLVNRQIQSSQNNKFLQDVDMYNQRNALDDQKRHQILQHKLKQDYERYNKAQEALEREQEHLEKHKIDYPERDVNTFKVGLNKISEQNKEEFEKFEHTLKPTSKQNFDEIGQSAYEKIMQLRDPSMQNATDVRLQREQERLRQLKEIEENRKQKEVNERQIRQDEERERRNREEQERQKRQREQDDREYEERQRRKREEDDRRQREYEDQERERQLRRQKEEDEYQERRKQQEEEDKRRKQEREEREQREREERDRKDKQRRQEEEERQQRRREEQEKQDKLERERREEMERKREQEKRELEQKRQREREELDRKREQERRDREEADRKRREEQAERDRLKKIEDEKRREQQRQKEEEDRQKRIEFEKQREKEKEIQRQKDLEQQKQREKERQEQQERERKRREEEERERRLQEERDRERKRKEEEERQRNKPNAFEDFSDDDDDPFGTKEPPKNKQQPQKRDFDYGDYDDDFEEDYGSQLEDPFASKSKGKSNQKGLDKSGSSGFDDFDIDDHMTKDRKKSSDKKNHGFNSISDNYDDDFEDITEDLPLDSSHKQLKKFQNTSNGKGAQGLDDIQSEMESEEQPSSFSQPDVIEQSGATMRSSYAYFEDDFDMLKFTNEYIKNTQWGKQHKLDLKGLDNMDSFIQIFEEFIQLGTGFFFDYSHTEDLFTLLEERANQNEELDSIVETYMHQLRQHYNQYTGKVDFEHDLLKMYFPFTPDNPFRIALIEKNPNKFSINIFFFDDMPQDQQTQAYFQLFSQMFLEIFECYQVDEENQPHFWNVQSIKIEEKTMQYIHNNFPEQYYVQYILLVFSLIYEKDQDKFQGPNILVNQKTAERVFYLNLGLSSIYEIIENQFEDLEAFFQKLGEQQQVKYKDNTIFFKKEYLLDDDSLEQIQQDVMELKNKKQNLALALLKIQQGGEEEEGYTFCYYLYVQRKPSGKFEVGIFTLENYGDQYNSAVENTIESLTQDKSITVKKQRDFTRHNGMYDYSDLTFPLWCHILKNSPKLGPMEALSVLNFSMIPYFTVFKGLE